MALILKQQIFELIERSKRILIVINQEISGDSLGSGLGLYLLFKKMEKEVLIASANHAPENLSFLPSIKELIRQLTKTRDLILSLDTSQKKVDQVRYETKGDTLDIFITPKEGTFEKKDTSFKPGPFKYDLIITLSSPDLEQLGRLYEENTELFFETPLLNIDHHSSNEHFGQINLIDLTASSTAEIVTALVDSLASDLVDEDISTCLLTGLIAETESFQKLNTTPRAFATAASLIAKGADQQKIIRFLYKTNYLPALKLWGRIMARLTYDQEYKLAWSLVPVEDFQKTGTKTADLSLALSQMASHSPDSRILLLLYQTQDKNIKGLVQVIKDVEIQEMANLLAGRISGQRIIFETASQNLQQAEKEILAKIKSSLK